MPTSSRSFIEVPPDSHFPIQNLPYGIFRPNDGGARAGVAIGDSILDLALLEEAGYFRALNFGAQPIFASDSLNAFLALGRPTWRKTREILQHLLAAETATLRDDKKLRARAFHRQAEVTMQLPARIGDYTDFYSSYHHAFNVGTMFRGPENALMPNWKWLPIAYHGRASSIVPSGAEVRRPHGQIKPPDSETPIFSASRALDFELETAFFVGLPNELGEPVPIAEAADHIFGLVLMNDWSARDIQTWEYQPLGPFLAKNFCTSISPWVVSLEALEPFRKPLPAQDPVPMDYLRAPNDFTFDIQLEVAIADGEDEGAGEDLAEQLPESLLEHGAATGPSHGRRLQPATGRSPGQRHDQRPDGRRAREHARADLARGQPVAVARGRDAQMAGGRRSPDDQRLGTR